MKIKITIIALFGFLVMNAQEKRQYRFTKEYTNQIAPRYDAYPAVYKMITKEVDAPKFVDSKKVGTQKENTYIKTNEELDLKSYEGTMEVYGRYVRIGYQDKLQGIFGKKALVPTETYIKYTKLFNKLLANKYGKESMEYRQLEIPVKDARYDGSVVYRDIVTKELYVGDIIGHGEDLRLVNFGAKVDRMGYKMVAKPKSEDYILTIPRGDKLILTNDIYKALNNGDEAYVVQVADAVKAYKAYSKKYKSKVTTLQNFQKEYRSRYLGGTLNSTFLTKYRAVLKKETDEHNKLGNMTDFMGEDDINLSQHIDIKTQENKLRITNMINKSTNQLQ